VLATSPADAPAVIAAFAARDIACAQIGVCAAGTRVCLTWQGETAEVWNLADAPLTGCRGRA
jgi:hypothetical protein